MSRVLVVDDEPQVCDLASRAIGQIGLACDTACDGQEAITRYEAQRHEAVITDLRMPRQHGHSLATHLLSRSEPPQVVVMTGLTDRRLLNEVMRLGVQDVFWKPFDYHSMALRVLTLTERERERGRRPRATPGPAEGGGASSELQKIEKSLMEITAIFSDRLDDMFHFETDLSEPPAAVTEFIERFAKLDEEAAARYAIDHRDRREKSRVACPNTATVVPVDRRFEPTGEPFMAAIQDVSESGVRLLHTRSLKTQYMALSWRAETLPYATIRVVAKVTRRQPRGLYYSIAGHFVLAD